MKRIIMTNDVAFEQSNTGANEESLRMVSASPVGNEPVSDEELRPHVPQWNIDMIALADCLHGMQGILLTPP